MVWSVRERGGVRLLSETNKLDENGLGREDGLSPPDGFPEAM